MGRKRKSLFSSKKAKAIKQERRSASSDEKTQLLEKDRIRKREEREKETLEQKESRLEDERIRKKEDRAKKTTEEKKFKAGGR